MDDAERAMRHEELSRQIAMTKRYPILSPTGYCHYCSEKVKGSALFCDAECLIEYENEADILAHQYACPRCGD